MKKVTFAALAASTIMFSSCGMGTSNTTTTNSTSNTNAELIGAAATALLGGTTGTTGTNSTSNLISSGLSILGTLLGTGSINSNSIVGTWTYAQPQVSFESSNVLAQIGGEVMGNKIESTLGTQLQKIGLKEGVSKFTFDSNGNVTVQMGTKKTTGTYKLNGNQLTMTGALGLTNVTSTVTLNANQLYMLFDASALFSAITKLGASNSTISSLLQNYSGLKLGWSMTK